MINRYLDIKIRALELDLELGLESGLGLAMLYNLLYIKLENSAAYPSSHKLKPLTSKIRSRHVVCTLGPSCYISFTSSQYSPELFRFKCWNLLPFMLNI